MELDGVGNPVREYSHYPGIDQPFAMRRSSDGAVFYYARELPGHVAGVINTADQVVNGYEYDPWGQALSTTEAVPQPIKYGGREYDIETGLYYNRTRYYDPQLGRFLGEDPIGLPGGLNPFAYAGDDPINGRDPFGLCKDGDVVVSEQLVIQDDGSLWRAQKCANGGSGGGTYAWWEPAGITLSSVTVSAPGFDPNITFPPRVVRLSQWERQLALDDFNAGIQRRSRIHAAEVIGQHAKCWLGTMAFMANLAESIETGGAGLEIYWGETSAVFLGSIGGLLGVNTAAEVTAGGAMVESGMWKLIGATGLSIRGLAWGMDASSGEFGWGNLVPGVGLVKAGHTIADNC